MADYELVEAVAEPGETDGFVAAARFFGEHGGTPARQGQS